MQFELSSYETSPEIYSLEEKVNSIAYFSFFILVRICCRIRKNKKMLYLDFLCLAQVAINHTVSYVQIVGTP